MSGFVDFPKPLLFSGISDSRVPLLTAEAATFFESIIVCNLTNDNIRVYLKINRVLDVNVPQESFLIHYLLIAKNQSLNLIDYLKACVRIANGDSLIVYSSSSSEKFDCTVGYRTLTDINNYAI